MSRILCYWLAGALLATCSFGETPGYLKVSVVQGSGAFNDIKHAIGHPLAVEVRDENDQLVSSAKVVFTFPATGASGTFSNGQRKMTVNTDAQGMAQAAGFHPNAIEGRFNIMVNVSYRGKEGSVVIVQSNTIAGTKRNLDRSKF